jgi:C4-dicarboxylate-specific signal transduction histidine kinase
MTMGQGMVSASKSNGVVRPPYRLLVSVSLFLCLVWTALVWLGTSSYREAQQESALAHAAGDGETQVAGAALAVEQTLLLRRGMAVTLARENLVRRFAAIHCGLAPSQEETTLQAELNGFLAKAEQDLGLDALWVGDGQGFGMAAARAGEPVSPIGINYADREYFQEAAKGRLGFQYAYGRTTKIGGLYLAAPVEIERKFCGFVLLKINTASLYPWLDQANALLSDENGVVIAAAERSFELKTLPGSDIANSSPAVRDQQYGRQMFEPLPFRPWDDAKRPELLQVGTNAVPHLAKTAGLKDFGLKLTVLQPVENFLHISDEVRLLRLLLLVLGFLVIAAAAASWGYLRYVRYSQWLLRRQKLQLDEAQRLALLGSWERDFANATMSWSDECRQIFEGPEDQTHISFADFESRIHPDDRHIFEAAFNDSLETKEPGSVEHRLVLDGGRLRTVHQRWNCQFDHAGKPTICFGYVQDITERKALEEELKRSNTELEQFAYAASHDLREPLRMVSSFVSLLERKYEGALDAEAHEFIAFARDGAQRMDSLINGLLNYSRVGHANLVFARVELGEIAREALLNLTATLEACQGDVEIVSGLPAVQGNHGELVRLVQNLVGNALKYRRPEAKPRIRINAARKGHEWVMTVSDNGIGIAPEHHERIFGIFQRLHVHQQYEGAGIGLAVCKKIVERHKGRIWVESEPGQGSSFSFTLPAID